MSGIDRQSKRRMRTLPAAKSCGRHSIMALFGHMKLVLLACVSLPLSLLAESGLPDKPYIYVEGSAEIEKPADMVTLRFDLVARNPDQNKANQEVQAKANKILALLKERK